MSFSRAILITLFFSLCLRAHAQEPVYFPRCDHSWIIRFGSYTYGLVQFADDPLTPYAQKTPVTSTTIYFGSRNFTVHTSVWPILAVLFAALAAIGWLLFYGIGSFAKPAEKPPPPNPNPPP